MWSAERFKASTASKGLTCVPDFVFVKLLMPNSNLSVLDFVSKRFDVLLVKTSN